MATLTHRIVSALVIVAVIGAVAWYYYQQHRLRRAGIMSEEILRNGTDWKADFVARIPAPEPQVFGAIEHVEQSHSDNVKSMRVLEQQGNAKTVEMVLAGPAGRTITTQLAFEYFPDQGRITYRTLGNPLLETRAEYKLESDGTDTIVNCHQNTRMLQSLPVPDAAVKQVISSLFVAQMADLRSSLHISAADDDAGDDDEP